MTGSALDSIQKDIAVGNVLVIDGGTGTELERRGADMHSDVWCAMATLSSPDVLRGVHEDYIRAGSRIITANTFSSSLNMLGPAGLADQFQQLNRLAVEIALEARDRMNANDKVAVAGSVSHQLPLIPGTDRRDPDKVPPAATVAANHREIASVLAGYGVDLLMLEMMSDPALANPAVAAARATGLPVWLGYTCRKSVRYGAASWTLDDMAMEEMIRRSPAWQRGRRRHHAYQHPADKPGNQGDPRRVPGTDCRLPRYRDTSRCRAGAGRMPSPPVTLARWP